jgi:hypothetical protein
MKPSTKVEGFTALGECSIVEQSKRRARMKKAIVLAIALLMLGTFPVFAETVTSSDEQHGAHTVTVHDPVVLEGQAEKPLDEWVLGAKFDAPNLVELSENWSIGAEASKDLRFTSADEGWSAYAKVTYKGCIICK